MSRKGLPRTAKRALYGNCAFCDPRQRFIRSSKPWERLSIDIVGPKPMTRNKNQYLSQWWMSLVGFPSPSLSGTSRLVASSMSLVGFTSPFLSGTSRLVASLSVFRHFSPSSEHLGSFTLTGAHSSCHRKSKNFCRQNWRSPKLCPTTLRAMAKTSATTELCGKPFSAC